MQKLLAFKGICFALFLFGVVGTMSSQEIAGKKNTLLQFDVSVSGDVLDALDPYDPSTSREKENFTEAKKVLTQLLHDKAYELLETKLKDKSIELEPSRTLEDHKLLYNDYGFPNVLLAKSVIKKVKKNGHSTEYYIAFSTSFSKGSDIFGTGKLSKQFKQNTKINCTIYDGNGKKLSKSEGSVVADKPTKAKDFPGNEFDKMEIDYMELLVESMEPGLDQAMDKLFKDF